eukprot:TRINITY_DN456_c0_g1_i1.p2 TRINITY_DN456_c0_g1~~TRINITY_DN456_c0_g1_i1.p2  ORF type:complete len:217 (-),score=87.86 TRINITY_DN456_c0_g1_i1:1522-2172(-)
MSGSFKSGAVVRLITVLGGTVEGVVFCQDSITKCVAIDCGAPNRPDFVILPISAIKSVETIRETRNMLPPQLPEISSQIIAQKEAKAIEDRNEARSKIGVGVSQEIQDLFDYFERLGLSCEWDKGTIVIAKTTRVQPPYFSSDAIIAKDQSVVNRVRQWVESFKKKNLASSSLSSSSSSSSSSGGVPSSPSSSSRSALSSPSSTSLSSSSRSSPST